MKKIYCISGLGSDHRLFANLSIPGYSLVPLPWVPYDNSDTLPTYAMKMAQQIPDKDPVILGLSFGGMLATEIARQMRVKSIILVSSAKTRVEVGFHSSIFKALNTIRPIDLFPRPYALILYYLGAVAEGEKAMLRSMIEHSDLKFSKWCINAILGWKDSPCPGNILQIHGTADKVIVPVNVKPHHWLKDGSHIMIYNRAEEISKLITDYLSTSVE